MIAPAEHALQCGSCHGDNGRLDWEALGYYGDPLRWGGRNVE
jgi:mono/diheme cytochrome c family protein